MDKSWMFCDDTWCDEYTKGSWSGAFTRELDCLVRQFAPVQVQSWTHIPAEKKEQLLQLAKKKFNIVGDEQLVRDNVFDSMQKLYSDWRSKSHIWYKKHGGAETGKQKPAATFKGRVHDWVWLCDNIFENKDWKEKSSKNCENRKKLTYIQHGGSKSFAQKRHEMTTKNNQRPNTLEFFIATHTNKDGELNEGAQKVVDDMNGKLASTEAEGSTADDVEEMLSGCVSKKLLVCSGSKRTRLGNNMSGEGTSRLQLNDEFQAIIDSKTSELEAQLSAKINDEVSKRKAAEEQIESQKVVIRDQEGVIISLQKDVADVKSDLNAIYRLLIQKQTSGTGPSN